MRIFFRKKYATGVVYFEMPGDAEACLPDFDNLYQPEWPRSSRETDVLKQ